ncbi:Glycosyltransferase, catalytic subunit of cellulose synthase and poly-beta-1,6-N-acetylglucosamine synthase [Parapedobacter luteus]|uniref:Glycosyltransferase, catalytic subunit of cellulose synthase and poly-beta-1,6-N-acetylglucosamine synthase n=1 Tax=Parapedobacter luteus TaxID=623280 RepID=A0A1T5C5Y4_9SPHI|nr:glycosyltransferase family 2 protein [Parapedobacter luteus]SKB54786.1 Glycosyltransferase, catalytic subunit of cellulose synthase and poly-beta-1,6-N-acetylglucosamine synthase [Parapedobacter luteus]
MKRTKPVIKPSKRERYTLRLMVAIGALCMVLFLKEILGTNAEYPALYWMLIATFVFACLKIVHEWIHYVCIAVPDIPKHERPFTVDIFTTFCAGEPYEMIRETLMAIQAIKYPHQTFLCDEADDPYLKNLCKELGVFHITRTVKIDAKAGNINNALKYSSAELCVILDPDHVPFPDFLDPIVSHFNDPNVGFVQIVQAYKNQDQGLIAKGAAQQTYQFYGPIMMSMNTYGTVLAIGANCTFRRAALDSIGGHAAGLAEDMHTAMQLHAKGWKSVYVPAVVARGLVPSTLSAYYSQQLKWARGVFELFVTSYPRLFGKFTWQQKLHYGAIPIYYLSGVFILINFLIPVISLLLNTSPINFDLFNFVTIGFPLFMSILLIRLFVQKWVMEEEERGVHIVGGLLMIGTWWIFLTGLIYTLLRKKVPYIPTPKDDSEDSNWRLNIPNLLVIAVSLAAVAYGLSNDWNPYNFIMAGFAAINCLILSFSIVASQQYRFRRFKERNWLLRPLMAVIAEFKKSFWKFRRHVYRGVRSTALMLTALIGCYILYHINTQPEKEGYSAGEQYSSATLVPGVFFPQQSNGLTVVRRVKELAQQSNISFGVVSCYVPWGDEPQCDLPVHLLDSIYELGSIPMITWEPRQSLFDQLKGKSDNDKEQRVFAAILKGDYDDYLARFSGQVKSVNRPIFIRFAHEADNPQYPWSAVGQNTAEEFKAAWRYIHRYFNRSGAYNAIWVWNPWKPEAVTSYFPGRRYVDWIGVTNLNYGSRNNDGKWYSMKELYMPFHEQPIFQSGIPVMLAEMGSLPAEGQQTYWFQTAFKDIKERFPEIGAVVFFNANIDYNTPDPESDVFLDWTIEDFGSLGKALNNTRRQTQWLTNRPINETLARPADTTVRRSGGVSFHHIKGVNYTKGQNWSTNGHALRKKEIAADFSKMKEMGFNTVKHFGPTFYDLNILHVARQKGLDVSYGFWLPSNADFISNRAELDSYAARILKTVAALKDNEAIIMWNIGNSPLRRMYANHYKPDLYYHNEAYVLWLQKLVAKIKSMDPNRPVSVDIEVDSKLSEHMGWLHHYIPDIDCFGLAVGDGAAMGSGLENLESPHFYSRINASDYLAIPELRSGFFIANWQDEQTPGFVSFDGLLDGSGNSKFEMHRLANRWDGAELPRELPELKILLPATTISKNKSVTYRVLLRDGKDWRLLKDNDGLMPEWKLIKTNHYGEPLETKTLGKGVDITFRVPGNPANFRIALAVSGDNHVKMISSKLHTPLNTLHWPEEALASFRLDNDVDETY